MTNKWEEDWDVDANSLSLLNICHTKEQWSPFLGQALPRLSLAFSAGLLLSLTHPLTLAVSLATEGAGTTPTPSEGGETEAQRGLKGLVLAAWPE